MQHRREVLQIKALRGWVWNLANHLREPCHGLASDNRASVTLAVEKIRHVRTCLVKKNVHIISPMEFIAPAKYL